jgi:hypothetical protein
MKTGSGWRVTRPLRSRQCSRPSGSAAALHHRAGPEAPLAVRPPVVEADGRCAALQAVQPFHGAVCRVVKRQARFESGDQPAASGHKGEGAESLGSRNLIEGPGGGIVAEQAPALDIRPPQPRVAHVPQRTFAQDVLDGHHVNEFGHCRLPPNCVERDKDRNDRQTGDVKGEAGRIIDACDIDRRTLRLRLLQQGHQDR